MNIYRTCELYDCNVKFKSNIITKRFCCDEHRKINRNDLINPRDKVGRPSLYSKWVLKKKDSHVKTMFIGEYSDVII